MARNALKRLMSEYKQLSTNPPEGIVAGPASEDNFFEWEAVIMGPEDTCFEGGMFSAILTFPSDYPLSPPRMRFTCDMFHPNIYPDGKVCISILHAPGDDAMGYESTKERWSPAQSVEKILLSVVSMLADPNEESAANVHASKMWREDREQFNRLAQQTVRKTKALRMAKAAAVLRGGDGGTDAHASSMSREEDREPSGGQPDRQMFHRSGSQWTEMSNHDDAILNRFCLLVCMCASAYVFVCLYML